MFKTKRGKQPLERRYALGHLHFITCSCYHRLPFLSAARARDCFLKILSDVRDKYEFALLGYVVMPEHIHLLISEPNRGNPSTVMRVLKQRVSRKLRSCRKRDADGKQLRLWEVPSASLHPRFWQRRFYDFNVWSALKHHEKLNYMHFNPVKRCLVSHPKEWRWSSYQFYLKREAGLCAPNPEWKFKQSR